MIDQGFKSTSIFLEQIDNLFLKVFISFILLEKTLCSDLLQMKEKSGYLYKISKKIYFNLLHYDWLKKSALAVDDRSSTVSDRLSVLSDW